jgi:hypothetical protein
MKEQLVSFQVAKLAKEKEFDVLCEHSFSEHDSGIQDNNQNGFRNWNKEYKNSYSRPTQTLLQKWLREVHNLYVEANPNASGYGWFIDKTNGTHIKGSEYEGPNDGGRWDIYEDALEIGLLEALKLI